MSFRGKIIKKEEIETPFGKIALEVKEYPPFPKRRKIIFWLGELKAVKLGEIITTYHAKTRKSDFEPLKYEPLYYTVKLTKNADADDVKWYYIIEEEEEEAMREGFNFDDEDKMLEFVEGLKCRDIRCGGIFVDTKRHFERWKKALKKLSEEE